MAPTQGTMTPYQRIQQRTFTIRKTTVPSLSEARVSFEGTDSQILRVQIQLKDSNHLDLEAQPLERRLYGGVWKDDLKFELALQIRRTGPSQIHCSLKPKDPNEPAAGTWTADEDWP